MTVAERVDATWVPTAKQSLFLSSRVFEVFYGGQVGGGKSDALLVDALGLGHEPAQILNPRYRALIIRRSYPELQELMDRSRLLYPAVWKGAKWSSSDKRWVFPSGARVEFGHLERDDDAYRYQGQEFVWLGIDELTHQSEWAFHWLSSRVRATDPNLRCYIRTTGNPGGKGHHWVKSRYVDVAEPGTVYVDPRTGVERLFIPSGLADNPHLASTDYAQRLQSLPDADRKALLEGDWNAYQGQVFSLTPGIHTWSWSKFKEVTGHDGIPEDWTRFRAMDWGYARPYAVVWMAMDHEGRLYAYREHYGIAKDSHGAIRANVGVSAAPKVVAEQIAAIELAAKERISQGWTGPDTFSSGTGDTTAGIKRIEAFNEAGVFFVPWDAGPASRVAKKMALHTRLEYEEGPEGTIAEYPGLIFLEDAMPHCIRTIPALEYDKTRVEDVDSSGEDHLYDAVAAVCLMRPWAPKRRREVSQWRDYRRKGPGWV